MTGEPPPWFRGAIVDGVSMLMALRLEGAPALDTIKATTAAWIRSLWRKRWWHQERDLPRIVLGFDYLCSSFDRWPAPVHLLRSLPATDPESPIGIRAQIEHLHYRQQHDPLRDDQDSQEWYDREIGELQARLKVLPNPNKGD